MKPLASFVTVLALLLVVPRLAAEETAAVPHVSDPEKVLSSDQAWKERAENKLVNFEKAAEFRILVRFHAKSPAPEEDKIPGAYMRALARQLGVGTKGVLAVYFADEEEWRLWVGDESTATFVGKPGTAAELTKSGDIHRTKEAFLTKVTAAGDAALAERKQTSVAWRRQLRTDAMIDGLVEKFRPPLK
ncbi:MAG: hypothetical protein JWM32_1219 [Verrucomicrobia bacterium]|nr:hypothetical protein [Verrucomicrobiota bacterium]